MSDYRVVYKYPLVLAATQDLVLPEQSDLLHVDLQFGHLMLWALVDPHGPTRIYRFTIVGTGQIAGHGRHVGTVIDAHSGFVWHVFLEATFAP